MPPQLDDQVIRTLIKQGILTAEGLVALAPGVTRVIDLGEVSVVDVADDALVLYTPAAGERIIQLMFEVPTPIGASDSGASLSVADVLTTTGYASVSLPGSGAYDTVALAATGSGLRIDGHRTNALPFGANPLSVGLGTASVNMVGAAWQPDTAYDVNDDSNLPQVVAAGHLWNPGGAGTSGSETPDWAGNVGGTVTDNDITWTDSGALPVTGTVHFYALVVVLP